MPIHLKQTTLTTNDILRLMAAKKNNTQAYEMCFFCYSNMNPL